MMTQSNRNLGVSKELFNKTSRELYIIQLRLEAPTWNTWSSKVMKNVTIWDKTNQRTWFEMSELYAKSIGTAGR